MTTDIILIVVNILVLVSLAFVIVDTKWQRNQFVDMSSRFLEMKQTLDMRTEILHKIEMDIAENRSHIDRMALSTDVAELKAEKLIETAEVKAAKLVANELEAQHIKATKLSVDEIHHNGTIGNVP